jgi:hypothetical protein
MLIKIQNPNVHHSTVGSIIAIAIPAIPKIVYGTNNL